MKIKIGEKEYDVEVAETEDQKEKGLQDLHYLPEDEGMLFIYEKIRYCWFLDERYLYSFRYNIY